MSTWVIVIIIAAVAAVVLIALLVWEQMQRRRLRDKFGPEYERTVKDRTAATTRVILSSGPLDQPCAVCGRPATIEVAWGRAY